MYPKSRVLLVSVGLVVACASGITTAPKSGGDETQDSPGSDADSARNDGDSAGDAGSGGGKYRPMRKGPKASLVPLPPGADVVSVHSPFESGDCSDCHESDDPKNPGKLTAPVTETCLECHDYVLEEAYKHAAAENSCTNCHSPHNSKLASLLLQEQPTLCVECHEDVGNTLTSANVKHGALTSDKSCSNCHAPHSSAVESLLVEMPFDLCMQCHSKDGLVDADGKQITNMKTLLDENPVWHAPVAGKDCSACHIPHGGEHFRLLRHDYPARFYAKYDAETYALCFQCHNEKAFEVKTTEELTQFRDGDRNLHFVHVNKKRRGRSCRACHEVHAGKQELHIRDSVPYGKGGWELKVNYEKASDGGSCDKTCHQKKSYKR